jgi:uncharacterized protein with von Willebrand factor type A (vWA) domain
MAQNIREELFTLDVKRTIYLIQVLSVHIEWFKQGIKGEHPLKTALSNVANSHKRLLLEISTMCSRKTWDLAQKELKEDYVKDLSLLLDELADIEDLTGIIEAIQKSKELWHQ